MTPEFGPRPEQSPTEMELAGRDALVSHVTAEMMRVGSLRRDGTFIDGTSFDPQKHIVAPQVYVMPGTDYSFTRANVKPEMMKMLVAGKEVKTGTAYVREGEVAGHVSVDIYGLSLDVLEDVAVNLSGFRRETQQGNVNVLGLFVEEEDILNVPLQLEKEWEALFVDGRLIGDSQYVGASGGLGESGEGKGDSEAEQNDQGWDGSEPHRDYWARRLGQKAEAQAVGVDEGKRKTGMEDTYIRGLEEQVREGQLSAQDIKRLRNEGHIGSPTADRLMDILVERQHTQQQPIVLETPVDAQAQVNAAWAARSRGEMSLEAYMAIQQQHKLAPTPKESRPQGKKARRQQMMDDMARRRAERGKE